MNQNNNIFPVKKKKKPKKQQFRHVGKSPPCEAQRDLPAWALLLLCVCERPLLLSSGYCEPVRKRIATGQSLPFPEKLIFEF